MTIQSQSNKKELLEKEKNSTANNSIYIQDTQLSRNNSIWVPDQLLLNEKLNSIPIQETQKNSSFDPKNDRIKTSNNQNFKVVNYDFLKRELPPSFPTTEMRPPLYGRPKVRPNNNSIDATNFSSFNLEKEFAKQQQYQIPHYLENTRSTNTLNSLSNIPDDSKRPIYNPRSRFINLEEPKSHMSPGYYAQPTDLYVNYHEILRRKHLPKNDTIENKELNTNNHHYSLPGGFKKFP